MLIRSRKNYLVKWKARKEREEEKRKKKKEKEREEEKRKDQSMFERITKLMNE